MRPVLLLLVLVAGCQASRRDPAQASRVAACRTQTDQAYRVRDRAAIMLPTNQRDTPFSSSYDPGSTSRGLGSLFGRDRMQADCVRGLGAAAPGDASTGPAFRAHSP